MVFFSKCLCRIVRFTIICTDYLKMNFYRLFYQLFFQKVDSIDYIDIRTV